MTSLKLQKPFTLNPSVILTLILSYVAAELAWDPHGSHMSGCHVSTLFSSLGKPPDAAGEEATAARRERRRATASDEAAAAAPQEKTRAAGGREWRRRPAAKRPRVGGAAALGDEENGEAGE